MRAKACTTDTAKPVPRIKFDLTQLPPAPDFAFEQKLWDRGVRHVGGIDEAGRGALAGPVCAAVVVLPPGPNALDRLAGVNDSKQLTAGQRSAFREAICSTALAYGVGFSSAEEIDRFGIIPATRLAVRRALLEMDLLPDHLLVDFLALPEIPIPQTSLVKGDARSLSIASASILAKTARDDRMSHLADQFPAYEWTDNKGYGTAAHIEALQAKGPCPLHRRSFAPIRTGGLQVPDTES